MTSGIYWAYQVSKDRGLYVGSSINISKRLAIHRTNLNTNKHFNARLQNIFNKYGASDIQWTTLEIVSPDNLKEREQFWVDLISPICNSKAPVDRPTFGIKLKPFTEEHRRNMAQSKFGKNNPNYKEVKVRDRSKESKFGSVEHRLKKSIAMKGRKFPNRPKRIITDEERLKRSERAKRQWSNPDIRNKMVSGLIGHPTSEKTRMAVAESNRRRAKRNNKK